MGGLLGPVCAYLAPRNCRGYADPSVIRGLPGAEEAPFGSAGAQTFAYQSLHVYVAALRC
jgi:hypothetical protein